MNQSGVQEQFNRSINQATFNSSNKQATLNKSTFNQSMIEINQSISRISINIQWVRQSINQPINQYSNWLSINIFRDIIMVVFFVCLFAYHFGYVAGGAILGQFVTRFWDAFLVSRFPQCLHFHGVISLFMCALDVCCNAEKFTPLCWTLWISWSVCRHIHPLTHAHIMVSFSAFLPRSLASHIYCVMCWLHCCDAFDQSTKQSTN